MKSFLMKKQLCILMMMLVKELNEGGWKGGELWVEVDDSM